MEDNLDNKIEFKDRIILFVKRINLKFTSIIFLIIIITFLHIKFMLTKMI